MPMASIWQDVRYGLTGLRSDANSGKFRWKVDGREAGTLSVESDIAVSKAETIERYLKQWYFAEPQFILIVLGA
jgi:hypothetical protein